MADFKHELSKLNEERITLADGRGMWRRAIPMPRIVGWRAHKVQCPCGKVFGTEEAYREHYIYQAVWMNESGYLNDLLNKKMAVASQNTTATVISSIKTNLLAWLDGQKARVNPNSAVARTFRKVSTAVKSGAAFADRTEKDRK